MRPILVVVEARGIDLKPGAQIDGDKPIVLKDGQVVTLISPSGKIIRVHGPMNAAPAAAEGDASVDGQGALKTLVTRELANFPNSVPFAVRPLIRCRLSRSSLTLRMMAPAVSRMTIPIVFWRPGGGAADKVTIVPYDRARWRAHIGIQGSDRLAIGG